MPIRDGNTYQKKMDEAQKRLDKNGGYISSPEDFPDCDPLKLPTAQEIADEEEWIIEEHKKTSEMFKKLNIYHHIYNKLGTEGRY